MPAAVGAGGAWLRMVTVWVGLVVCGSAWVHAQIPEAPIRGFTLPMVDRETLRLKARVRGDVATPMGEERIEIQGLRLESLGEENRTNLVLTTERCVLWVNERRLESSEALRVETGDGQMRLGGEGFSWDQAEGLIVSNRVDAELRRPAVARRAAGWVEEVGTGAAEMEPMRILSTQFRFREGAAAFLGDVRVSEGVDRLHCERLRLGFLMQPGDLAPSPESGVVLDVVDRIEADGGVEVATADLVAEAERAVYDLEVETIQMSGRAHWRSGNREGTAEAVELDRVRNRLWAEGGVRVRFPMGEVGGEGADGVESGAGGGDGAMIEVRARTLEIEPDPFEAGLSRAVFRENVEVIQGTNGLSCEVLRARYTGMEARSTGEAAVRGPVLEGSGLWVEVKDARAEGGVRLSQGENEVEGSEAFYQAALGVVDVEGPVVWSMERRSGRSDRLRLYVLDRLTEALGGVRMRLPAGSLGSVDRVLAAGVGAREGVIPGTEEESKEPQGDPVDIRCEEFRFRDAGPGRSMGLGDFSGGVEVSSGEAFQLRCVRLLAEMPPGTNAIHRLVAAGQVEIAAEDARGKRLARGDRAEYLGADDMLWLTGEDGVEMELEDEQGRHRGRGRLAVYDGNLGVLELRTGAVLDSVHGRLMGEVVRVDSVRHVVAAGGNWRLRFSVGEVGREVAPWP